MMRKKKLIKIDEGKKKIFLNFDSRLVKSVKYTERLQ